MDTLQCAVVLGKLDRFEWEVRRRLELGEAYKRKLGAAMPGLQLLEVKDGRDCVWAQYTVFVDDRDTVQARLKAAGVPTAVHYPRPLHHQPAYAKYGRPDDCPHSIAAAKRVMSLPMSADLTEAQQDEVVSALVQALA
jgi:UDP-2-acetamido-2-deoxy-ribo-hexuluronate aminotransferase